ncbi:MAG: hypothetical protein K2K27_00745 [Muribaculaceae bacterium]|nr:hypothetical protein [Muribaculaceae bacterium]
MKIFITTILLLFGTIFLNPLYAHNEADDEYNIEVSETEDGYITDPFNNGHRSAPMLTPCTISYRNGVTIFSIEGTVNIVSYEIWNVNGETCHGVYPAERQFINALFANKGEYIVVFTTTDKKYTGYIWLE